MTAHLPTLSGALGAQLARRRPELRLKMRFRQLADGVVLAYAEPRIICRDPRAAEWAAFEAWAATPGNIVEFAPDAGKQR